MSGPRAADPAARLRRVLAAFHAAVGAGVVGLALLALAVAVAASRFGRCGASALDAADAACRSGARLVVAAYALLSIALVLGATALTLLWRLRRDRRR